MRIKDIIGQFITTGTIIPRIAPSQRLMSPYLVEIRLLLETEACHGVVRTWRISCTLPALSQESSGLLQLGLTSMAERLRRILALSSCGTTMSEKSWVDHLADGRFCLVMTAVKFEPASVPPQGR